MIDTYKLACDCAKNGTTQVLLNALINIRAGCKAKCKKDIMRAISECGCLDNFEKMQFIDVIKDIAYSGKESRDVREAALHCLEALETTNSKIGISVDT